MKHSFVRGHHYAGMRRHDPQRRNLGILLGAGLGLVGIGSGAAITGASLGADLGLSTLAGSGILGGSLAGEIGGGILGLGTGAALGAGEAALTGGNPLTGALTGGLTGGVIGGIGGPLGSELGIGTTGGDALAGAAAGLTGNALTGGNPLTGALTGGLGGLASGLLSGGTSPGSTTAPGPSAAATAPPAGAAGQPIDLTNLGSTGSQLSSVGGQPLITGTNLGSDSIATSLPAGGTTANVNAIPGINAAASSAAAAASPSSSGIFGQLGEAINHNPLGALLAGGGLAYNMLSGSALDTQINALGKEANQLGSQSRKLENYLQTGTLPPGIQEQVDQATQAAEAQARNYYAGLGLSGSSMEQQAIGQIRQNAAMQTAQIGTQLLQTGISEAGLQGNLLQGVIGANQKQAQSTGLALASLAAALSGRPPTIPLGTTSPL